MKFRIKEERQGKTVPLNSTLMSVLEEYDLKESFFMEKIRGSWRGLVGDIMSTHSLPDRIYKKILFICVDHSIFANELGLMKDSLLEGINSEFGFEIIRDIRITTKKLNWADRVKH